MSRLTLGLLAVAVIVFFGTVPPPPPKEAVIETPSASVEPPPVADLPAAAPAVSVTEPPRGCVLIGAVDSTEQIPLTGSVMLSPSPWVEDNPLMMSPIVALFFHGYFAIEKGPDGSLLEPGDYWLRVDSEGFGQYEEQVFRLERGDNHVDVVLGGGAELLVDVLYNGPVPYTEVHGEQLRGFTVAVFRATPEKGEDEDPLEFTERYREAVANGAPRQESVSANPESDWFYSFVGLCKGRKEVRVQGVKEDGTILFGHGYSKELAPDGVTTVSIVVDEGLKLRGVVVDEFEMPVEGVEVEATGVDDNPGMGTAITKSDGTFEISGLPPGDYDVDAEELFPEDEAGELAELPPEERREIEADITSELGSASGTISLPQSASEEFVLKLVAGGVVAQHTIFRAVLPFGVSAETVRMIWSGGFVQSVPFAEGGFKLWISQENLADGGLFHGQTVRGWVVVDGVEYTTAAITPPVGVKRGKSYAEFRRGGSASVVRGSLVDASGESLVAEQLALFPVAKGLLRYDAANAVALTDSRDDGQFEFRDVPSSGAFQLCIQRGEKFAPLQLQSGGAQFEVDGPEVQLGLMRTRKE